MHRGLFAGAALRLLRQRHGLRQAAMASRLGISAAYLSQLEHDERPLTAALAGALAQAFPVDWPDLAPVAGDDLASALIEALAEPQLGDEAKPDTLIAQAERLARQFPAAAARIVRLHQAWRDGQQRLERIDEAIEVSLAAGGRLPWEEVRDWFHHANNYVDSLDRAAEALAARISGDRPSPSLGALATWLAGEGQAVEWHHGGALRRYDAATRTLTLDAGQPPETSRFQLAWQVAVTALADAIAAIVAAAPLQSDNARQLLTIGLGNYAAGALLMPYEAFRSAARAVRHDIDQLRQPFAVSFEQACHRLSTLQRPQARGLPVFFCRVDMAGNVTKRHSATRLAFARYGGACPLWIVHEAVAIPDRIHVQLAEMPDATRYVAIAKGLVKPSGSFLRPPRRYAVTLGCEAALARDFLYADGLNLTGATPAPATLIGSSCRTCPRDSCDQRAFPPSDRTITINPTARDPVPYRIQTE